MDYANATNVKFIVDPRVLFPGWLIYSYLHLRWSSDCQGSVQIVSLTTLWHDHFAFIDDTPCLGRKIALWLYRACAEPWTCPFKETPSPCNIVRNYQEFLHFVTGNKYKFTYLTFLIDASFFSFSFKGMHETRVNLANAHHQQRGRRYVACTYCSSCKS